MNSHKRVCAQADTFITELFAPSMQNILAACVERSRGIIEEAICNGTATAAQRLWRNQKKIETFKY